MVEPKVSLSLLVPGAQRLSEQECSENPKYSYDDYTLTFSYTKGKGKNQKKVRTTITIKTRKQRLITQNINITDEAYNYMLSTPTSAKFAKALHRNAAGEVTKRVWDIMPIRDRLNKHFDLIAHDLGATSYSYEILDD